METVKPNDTGLGRNVVALGWVAFFGGLAQDMIQPILPTFYTAVLGLNKEFIGLIEGSLTTVVSLMKIGAGYLSDALGLRKAIVFVGYALSALARFSLGLAGSGAAVFGLRVTDGVGKGLKDAPRDALVAGSAGNRKLGFAFGVQRTLDTLGSVAGPLIAYELLRVWATHPNKYREVFLVAGLIAAVPLLIIGLLVRERKAAVSKQRPSFAVLKGPFAGFLAVMLLFTLGNSSDAFLILRRRRGGGRGDDPSGLCALQSRFGAGGHPSGQPFRPDRPAAGHHLWLGCLRAGLSWFRRCAPAVDDLGLVRFLRPLLCPDRRLRQGDDRRVGA